MSIQISHVIKRFGSQAVVNDISLDIRDGELFVLLGPSGSGKSTLLRMIAGLASTDGGTVVLHGRDVTRLRPRSADGIRSRITAVPALTATQNIASAGCAAHAKS